MTNPREFFLLNKIICAKKDHGVFFNVTQPTQVKNEKSSCTNDVKIEMKTCLIKSTIFSAP